MSRKFKINYTHAIGSGSNIKVFDRNTVFELAGLELSTHSEYSPFHYKGDIIRLPNYILEEVIDTCETKKVEKVWEISVDLNGIKHAQLLYSKPTDDYIAQYASDMGIVSKQKIETVNLEFYYKIIDNV